jgi:hypothetical protein
MGRQELGRKTGYIVADGGRAGVDGPVWVDEIPVETRLRAHLIA